MDFDLDSAVGDDEVKKQEGNEVEGLFGFGKKDKDKEEKDKECKDKDKDSDKPKKKAKSDDKGGENSSLKTEGESGGLGSFGTRDFSCGTCGSQISSSLVYSSLPSETLSRTESSSASRSSLTAIESLMGHPQSNTLETDRDTTSRYT